jgi:hypothetical protein
MQGLEQEKLGLLQRPNDTVATGQQQQKMKLLWASRGHDRVASRGVFAHACGHGQVDVGPGNIYCGTKCGVEC